MDTSASEKVRGSHLLTLSSANFNSVVEFSVRNQEYWVPKSSFFVKLLASAIIEAVFKKAYQTHNPVGLAQSSI